MAQVGYNVINPPGISADLNAAAIEADKMHMLKRQQTQEMWQGIFDVLKGIKTEREKKQAKMTMEENVKNPPEGYEVKQTYKINPQTGEYEPSYEVSAIDAYKQMMAAMYKKQQEEGKFGNIRVKPGASGFIMDEMFTPEKIAQTKGAIVSKGIFAPMTGTTIPIDTREDAENYLNIQLGPGWRMIDPELETILEQSYPSALPSATLPSGEIVDQQVNVQRYGQRVPPPQAYGSPYMAFMRSLFRPEYTSPATRAPWQEPVEPGQSAGGYVSPAVSPLRLKAIQELQKSGYPVTPANIEAVIKQLQNP